MKVFKIKTGDENTYKSFHDKNNSKILVEHLIQYDSEVKIGMPVFLLFGGDGTPWINGLAGLCKVASLPIDLGYEKAKNGKYFKLELEIVFRLRRHLTKMDFSLYPKTYDTGIGPSTKGERNQALGTIEDNESIGAICRAIIDDDKSSENCISEIFGEEIFNIAMNETTVYVNPNQSKNEIKKSTSLPLFSQTIYYGVPGCGKSHSISAKLRELGISKSDECNFTKRIVFHPEYTNADFIGQILPETNEGKTVSYPFKAGPFTEILAQAYTHKNQNYALVIEEINRGNAAAIFGELFQLLDRLDKTENESSNDFKYTAGWSSYPVNNDNINKAIQEAYSKSDIEPFLPKEIFEKYKLNVGIRLPPNLSLLATMNTSDQNVFVLDNAFQRRWNMCLVPNVFSDTAEERNQRTAKIGDSEITWETFQTKINQTIAQASKDSGFSSMVDKRLGCWFVKAEKNDEGKFVIKEEAFKNKILKYLWDDAFKFDRGNYFVDADSFEDLQNKVSMSETNFGVFKEIEFTENSSKTEEELESTD